MYHIGVFLCSFRKYLFVYYFPSAYFLLFNRPEVNITGMFMLKEHIFLYILSTQCISYVYTFY